MHKNKHMRIAFCCLLVAIISSNSIAGPPFNTDDPEPVAYNHWEYYLASTSTYQSSLWQGTSPHAEVNYGAVPNLQLHVLLPLNYNYIPHHGATFGFANSELGMKYRFVNDTTHRLQIGVFPIIELPTLHNNTFGDGNPQLYLPLWLQKSWGNLTTYGGGGYWIHGGTHNKNWMYAGWEIQYDFSPLLMLGTEVYFHTADAGDSKWETGFTIGGSINATEKFHIIFSAGHTVIHTTVLTSYLGLLWTI